MKIKKLSYITAALTVSSAALVIAAPKHTPPRHPPNTGGHGKTTFGAKGRGQTNLARTSGSRFGNNQFGHAGGQTDASPTPTPTPDAGASPTPGQSLGN
jgi:hypothetical protein